MTHEHREYDERLDGMCACTVLPLIITPYTSMLESMGKLNPAENARVIATGIEHAIEANSEVTLSDALGMIVLATLTDWAAQIDDVSICERLDSANEHVREATDLTVEDML